MNQEPIYRPVMEQEQLIVERVPEVIVEPWWAEWSLQIGIMIVVPIVVAYLINRRKSGDK